MTLCMPKRKPPHLRQQKGIWWCCDAVTCGTGMNQKQAWNDWFKRRNLIDRMHPSLEVTGFGVLRERQ